MVLARIPEKKAAVKLAPLSLCRCPQRNSGAAQPPSLAAQPRDSMACPNSRPNPM